MIWFNEIVKVDTANIVSVIIVPKIMKSLELGRLHSNY
jgi:hypothetical protein